MDILEPLHLASLLTSLDSRIVIYTRTSEKAISESCRLTKVSFCQGHINNLCLSKRHLCQ
jgi:hypothetical protein